MIIITYISRVRRLTCAIIVHNYCAHSQHNLPHSCCDLAHNLHNLHHNSHHSHHKPHRLSRPLQLTHSSCGNLHRSLNCNLNSAHNLRPHLPNSCCETSCCSHNSPHFFCRCSLCWAHFFSQINLSQPRFQVRKPRFEASEAQFGRWNRLRSRFYLVSAVN